MTVLRIKQLVGMMGAWTAVLAVAIILALAGLAVVEAGSGADPEAAFTDPASLAVGQRSSWNPGGYGALVDDETRAALAIAWFDTVARPDGARAEFDVIFATEDLELVQLRVRLGSQTETFETTFVQQPTGWTPLHHARVAA